MEGLMREGNFPCPNSEKRKRDSNYRSTTSTDEASKKEVKIDDETQPSLSITHTNAKAPDSSLLNDGFPGNIIISNRKDAGKEIQGDGTLDGLPYGMISVIGRRRAMEDAVMAVPKLVARDELGTYDFYAVYDGHGGSRVANACKEMLHQLLEEETADMAGTYRAGGGGRVDWVEVMEACFAKMDEEVCNRTGGGMEEINGTVTVQSFGTTAVIALVGKEEIVVANCGDSRAVLFRSGLALPLSLDHKPDRPDERERVEAAGGRVINADGPRVLGILATSRSIGHKYLKPYLIAEPEVTVNKKTEMDEFLILATDGLWDVVSNETACEVVKKCLYGQMKSKFFEDTEAMNKNGTESLQATSAAEAAAVLAELAMAKGSKDNISAVIVQLKQ